MSPRHSYHMSQGSQVSQSTVFQKCLLVSDEATYRAVPLFSEGQLKKMFTAILYLKKKRCSPLLATPLFWKVDEFPEEEKTLKGRGVHYSFHIFCRFTWINIYLRKICNNKFCSVDFAKLVCSHKCRSSSLTPLIRSIIILYCHLGDILGTWPWWLWWPRWHLLSWWSWWP